MPLVFNPPRRASPAFGSLQLDWSNPITLGMTDCLVWNAGGNSPPNNLASPSAVTTLTGSPTDVMTAVGPAGYATGGSAFNIPNHLNYSAGDFTIRVLFLPVTWTGGFTALLDKFDISTGREISFFINTSGNVSFVAIGTGGGPTASTAMTAGSIWDFVIQRSGTTVTYYVNGIFIASGAGAGTTGATTGLLSFGGNTSGGGTSADAQYLTAQLWTRALSDSEIALLYSDPYNFLIPLEGEMPALLLPSAVSSGIPMGQILM